MLKWAYYQYSTTTLRLVTVLQWLQTDLKNHLFNDFYYMNRRRIYKYLSTGLNFVQFGEEISSSGLRKNFDLRPKFRKLFK